MNAVYTLEPFLNQKYLNAAGSLGFIPPASSNFLKQLGAFVTNPISLTPRKPAAGRAVLPYPGGFLLHTGLPNPGLKTALRRFGHIWARSELPVWVHIIPGTPDEAESMVRQLENVEGVLGIELGLPLEADPDQVMALVEAAAGELPLIISLPVQRCQESWLQKLATLQISALSIAAPRGALIDPQGRGIAGRLYGPALYPLALAALKHLSAITPRVTVSTGVYSKTNADQLLRNGAFAVAFDSMLWKAGNFFE